MKMGSIKRWGGRKVFISWGSNFEKCVKYMSEDEKT